MATVVFPDGLEVKALTRDAELRSALTDRRFVRGLQHWKALQDGTVDPNHPMAQMMHIDSLLVYDGDLHTNRRKMLAPGFSPAAMRTLTPVVEQIVVEQLDLLAKATGPVDLKAEYAFPVTVRVLCALLGLDVARMPSLAELIRTSMSGTGAGSTDQVRQAVIEVLTHKRTDPDEHIITTLVEARDDNGQSLSERELVDTVMLLVSAGYETTMGALVNIVHTLLIHPEQLNALVEGDLMWEQVITEGLRHDGPVNVLSWLFATEDIDYPDGQHIEAGQAVLMCYLAANLDPHRHGTAHQFSPQAGHPANLAFGHGPHHCLGRPLARLELNTALPQLFKRFPDLQLVQEPVPEPSVVMNQPQQLLVHTRP